MTILAHENNETCDMLVQQHIAAQNQPKDPSKQSHKDAFDNTNTLVERLKDSL